MKIFRLCCWLAIVLLLNGCYTYSNFQSAKLLVKGKYEITPSYSSVSFANDGQSQEMSDNFGVQLGYGLSDNVNVRFRFENIAPEYDGISSYNFVAIEPKFSLIKDRSAFSLPIGFFTGSDVDDSETIQIHPTVHLTFPLSENFDLNFAPKFLIFLDEDADDGLIALNAGLGFSTYSNKIVIRPEIGYLWDPGEEGHFFSWGLGISLIP
ncbi:hypothetical protein ACFLYK_03890 [Candidatus Cloacimonadota bacterium]